MKVLLLSNQGMTDNIIGNPIMLRMRDTLKEDSRIEEVKMLRCKDPFKVRKELRSIAKEVDVIHIHFGGAYAFVVWFLLMGIKRPKFITFHGTDIHAKAIKTAKSKKEKYRIKLNQVLSFLCIPLYDRCGFVAKEMIDYVPSWLQGQVQRKGFIQSLGVDYNRYVPMTKEDAQKYLNLASGNYVLFSDVHNSKIKRRDIAEAIVKELDGKSQLLIMCGVHFNEVPYYINVCDFVLLTSDEEGSPNIIREALSLNKPVFSVDVGDASQQLAGLKNSCIISRDAKQAAISIKNYLSSEYTDNTREKKRESLDFARCNKKIIDLYIKCLQNRKICYLET